MTIKECMKKEVFCVRSGTNLTEVVSLLVEKKIGTLPVVTSANILVGVVSITDIINIFVPDFVSIMHDIDFVKDYGPLELALEDMELVEKFTVDDIMDKEPTVVEEDCNLVRALSLMKKHNLSDLPVVRKGKLVGLASSVDICQGFLRLWQKTRK